MGSEVAWLLQVAVKPGKRDDFNTLMKEMVESTRAESGTLAYEWFGNDDSDAVHIFERYADSAATLVHLGAFGENFAGRFLETVDPTSFVVYGDPNADVRAGLEAFGATYHASLAGFTRDA